MADKSLRRSSGSSLNLRNHMNDNYVIVHNVSSSVAFEKYIQFARSVFSYAVRLYNKKDYQRAYVDFTKFQRFVHEKLPSHEGYDHERYLHAKKWLLQADEAASQFLEEISFQLDILEDQKLNPDSRSVFMQEMQKHVVDIIIPEWIDSEIPHHSDGGSSRSRSTSNAHDHHLKEHSSSPSTSSVYGRSSSQSKALAYTNTHVHAHSHAGASPRATHAHHNDHPGIASDPAHLQLKPPSSQELYHHHTGQSYPHTPSSSSSSQHYSEVVHHSQQPQRAHAVPLHLAPVHAVGSHGHSAGRSGSNSPAQSAHRSVHHSHGVYNGDGMYQASFSHTPRPAGHHLSAAAAAPPKFVLPGIYAEDAAIMRYYRMYTRFDIPMPTVSEASVTVGAHSYMFEQHDFHISYAPFLKALPPELCMGRSATEVNRCFFIHLGVATQLHPFVLQSFFRFTAASERDEEEDWEQELAKTVTQYSGCVDANVLQYMWPTNFDKYRILLVSGPSTDPLLTCFVPVNRTRPVEDLYEVIIRNERDHYTLLRPVASINSRIKIIDSLLLEAKQQNKMYQVCDVKSTPSRCVEIVMDQI